MKSGLTAPSRDLKSTKTLQRKMGGQLLKSKYKDQNLKHQRVGLYANAGHVRGGHSFH